MKAINQVIRSPKRGSNDQETIIQFLRNENLCHIAFADGDASICIPMFYFVWDKSLCIHGSKASRLINRLKSGGMHAVAVTKVDGIVLARSAFHHSMNYRSVVAHGKFKELAPADKQKASEVMIDQLVAGRSQEVRMPSESELKQTVFLTLDLNLAAFKQRTGPPVDDEADIDQVGAWVGVVPLATEYLLPIPDQFCDKSAKTPKFLG
ncbi:MAG: pyridoxamine 5'-phosphate oxidase family protein [Pseudobacteriovorax sp.]|nr:pyridoxamine 5'-phosphate oxidase family protein [Pseudobacteriovorax sp.]